MVPLLSTFVFNLLYSIYIIWSIFACACASYSYKFFGIKEKLISYADCGNKWYYIGVIIFISISWVRLFLYLCANWSHGYSISRYWLDVRHCHAISTIFSIDLFIRFLIYLNFSERPASRSRRFLNFNADEIALMIASRDEFVSIVAILCATCSHHRSLSQCS